MGERLLCKQEVIGSIPFTSTTGFCEVKCRRTIGKSEFAGGVWLSVWSLTGEEGVSRSDVRGMARAIEGRALR